MNRTSTSGFTLIEILVAMLVLAVGLLGVAALQFKGLQFNNDAYLRSQVSILVYDIADRMRLNKKALVSYEGTLNTTGTAPKCNSGAATTAANDLNCWQVSLMRTLPVGTTATIAKVAGTTEYSVTINWTDRDGGNHPTSYIFRP